LAGEGVLYNSWLLLIVIESITMEYRDNLPKELQEQFDEAVQDIPPCHRRRPEPGDEIDDANTAREWFQSYAFTQGFVVVTESKSKIRLQMECIHHKNKTRNYRQLADHIQKEDGKTVAKEGARQREETHTKAAGCSYRIYASYRRVPDEERYAWLVGISNDTHNHPPPADPFYYIEHRHRRPGHALAKATAIKHRAAGLSATQSARILRQDGLILSSVEYYNCTRSEGRMTKEDEMRMLLTCLEQEDFWVRVKCKYHSSNSGERKRIVDALFFCSSEQIRLGQRFVSQFLMETDATFNTNSLYLPLSVVVGITNTGKTFPLAYTWIT
jgi:hypothetical protein